MKPFWIFLFRLLCGGSASLLAMTVMAQPLPDPLPDHWYRHLVDIDFVRPYAVLPRRDDVLLVDTRDRDRRYAAGHLPGAISLPAKRFDELAGAVLPADKHTLIIFYCDGIECKLSHMAADDAEDLGYTQVRVYARGYPEWFRQGNITVIGRESLAARLASGEIGMVIDVRPRTAFEQGHVPGAIHWPASEFEHRSAAMLPSDKQQPLLFYCDRPDASLSYTVAQQAHALGYTHVMLLDGGYAAWSGQSQ